MARLLAPCICLLLGGCAGLGYYAQAVSGQMQILALRQPVQEVVSDPDSPRALGERLERVAVMREFAISELALPDNDSYRTYADLGREHVVYSVIAAPALSLTPEQFCYPVVGCLSYRGYFALRDAARTAEALRRRGLDVYVAPVPAYSTLGWFADPLLNTFVAGPEFEVARLMFHELAHQRVFVAGDTDFNEAYATAVDREGQRRWLQRHGSPDQRDRHRIARHRQRQFGDLVDATRERLHELYESDLPAVEKLDRKAHILEQLRFGYSDLKASWGGYGGYDRWFAQDLNNAKLALSAAYNELVPGFMGLLRALDGDLQAFHEAVEALAREDPPQRRRRLGACASSSSTCLAGIDVQ